MIRRRFVSLAAWALGLAGLMATAPSAQAGFFDYTSSVVISPIGLSPAGSTITGGGTVFNTVAGNSVSLTANSLVGAPHQNANNSGTDFVPLSISAVNTGTSQAVQFDFTLTVNITDFNGPFSAGSNGTVAVVFSGRIGGSLGDFQTNLTLLSFVPNPGIATIGNTVYTVGLVNFANPGGASGALTLHATARTVPEPGSLALLGLGGIGLAAMVRRRRAKASA